MQHEAEPTKVSQPEHKVPRLKRNRRRNSMNAIPKIKPDQMDPNNDAFWRSRGQSGRPVKWKIPDENSK